MNAPRAGAVRLAPTAFVAPGAVVLGEVTLGPRASVWFNTVVRGDVDSIELGEASNLQDNTTVHLDAGQPVRIGARVTVGHRVIVHGCVIEDDCLIGMGSVLLSGCRIGAGSYIGASSLVLEGVQIPPGSVAVGSPARVIGPVRERHRDGIRHGFETYADLAAACMRRGMARHVGRGGEITRDRPEATWGEWRRRLDELARLPERLASVTGSEPQRLALVDACRAADRQERRPLLETLARGEPGTLSDEPSRPVEASADLAAALGAWQKERASLLERLRPMGPEEWRRLVGHPTRGPFTVFDLAEEWREDDEERFAEASRP